MEPSKELEFDNDWQTQSRGSNQDEYEIYVACAESLGWDIKTYDEWIES